MISKQVPKQNYETVLKLIKFISARLNDIEIDDVYEKAIENAFLMTPKIPKNLIKAMCDATETTYLDNEKEILFINLLDRLVEMTLTPADTLMDTLLPMISDYGSVIRTNNAPAFQKLVAMSLQDNSVFKNLNIILQLGDALNPNKNPIAENAVKELEKELLRLNLSNKQIQPVTLSLAVKNVNYQIRQRGFLQERCVSCNRRQRITTLSLMTQT